MAPSGGGNRLEGQVAESAASESADLPPGARWKAEGLTNRQIAKRLGITEKVVRKQLRRLGWRPEPPEAEEAAFSRGAEGADPNLSGPVDSTRLHLLLVAIQ